MRGDSARTLELQNNANANSNQCLRAKQLRQSHARIIMFFESRYRTPDSSYNLVAHREIRGLIQI